MDFLVQALKALPEAATSGSAAVLYIVTIVAWVVIAFRTNRNKDLLERLEKLPESERAGVLRDEMGVASLREGLTAEQWLRSQTHRYYFLSFVVVVVAGVGLFVIAALIYVKPQPTPAILAADNCKQLLARGALLVSEGHIDDAAAKFRDVSKQCPNWEDGWRNLGLAELGRNRFDDAFEAFKQALKVSPQDPANKFNLAIAYLQLNNNPLALDILRELNRDAPADVNINYNLALTYQRMGYPKEARAHYKAVIERSGELAGAAAFNLAAEIAASSSDCNSNDTAESISLLQSSLNIAVKEGNVDQRMRRITGQLETENGDKLKTIRNCPQLTQLLASYR